MQTSTQLQFQLLEPEAQHGVVQRLALSGASIEQIATHTGWTTQEIRRVLGVQHARADSRPAEDPQIHWIQRAARAGTTFVSGGK